MIERRRKLSSEQKQSIVDLYKEGKSASELSKSFQVNESTIRAHIKRRGIPQQRKGEGLRKHFFNDSFFNVIDSEEKAYFLGFLYADGYNEQNRNTVKMSLAAHDKYILERFKLAIGSTRPLVFRRRQAAHHQDQYTLVLNSIHLCKRLTEVGCHQAKSYSLTYPHWMDEAMQPHFIRGFFDGDGCICTTQGKAKTIISKHSKTVVQFVSSMRFCLELAEVLRKNCGFDSTVRINKEGYSTEIGKFSVQGNLNIMQFYGYCYGCCKATIYLTRKKERFEEINLLYQQKPQRPRCCTICGSSKVKGFGLCGYHYYQHRFKYLRAGKTPPELAFT